MAHCINPSLFFFSPTLNVLTQKCLGVPNSNVLKSSLESKWWLEDLGWGPNYKRSWSFYEKIFSNSFGLDFSVLSKPCYHNAVLCKFWKQKFLIRVSLHTAGYNGILTQLFCLELLDYDKNDNAANGREESNNVTVSIDLYR